MRWSASSGLPARPWPLPTGASCLPRPSTKAPAVRVLAPIREPHKRAIPAEPASGLMGHGNAASHGLQHRHELGGVIRPAGPGKRVSCLFPVAPRRLTGIPPPGRLSGDPGDRHPGRPTGDRRRERPATTPACHPRPRPVAGRPPHRRQSRRGGRTQPRGGWVALRLVVDNRGLVARLLLLDPTPLTPSRTLRSMAAFKLLAVLDRSAGTSS